MKGKIKVIKRLIFDIDETLITNANDYDGAVFRALKKVNYPNITKNLPTYINNAEEEYEEYIANIKETMDRQEMLDFINQKLNLDLSIEFVNIWMKELIKCIPEKYSRQDYKTLEYLYNKYELVLLTNWFEESQIGRLEALGLYKFFKDIIPGEMAFKPNKEAFILAAGENKPEDCAMIGDDIKKDIIAAKSAGIGKLIWKDNKDEKEKYKNELTGIEIIKRISDLKEIL